MLKLKAAASLSAWLLPGPHFLRDAIISQFQLRICIILDFFLLNLTVVRSLAQPFLLRLWLQELLNGSKFTIAFLNIVLAWASFFDEKKGVQWHVHKCRIWKMGPEEKCWWRHGSATLWKLVRCTFGCQTVMWSVDVWDGQAKLLNHPRPCPARPRWGA